MDKEDKEVLLIFVIVSIMVALIYLGYWMSGYDEARTVQKASDLMRCNMTCENKDLAFISYQSIIQQPLSICQCYDLDKRELRTFLKP
jgi:hypothetical protein